MTKQWWHITANGRYIGKCFETLANIIPVIAPYYTVQGDHIVVYGRPR